MTTIKSNIDKQKPSFKQNEKEKRVGMSGQFRTLVMFFKRLDKVQL